MTNTDLVLGIDIGGTKTTFGFVDRAGHVSHITSMETDADTSAETFVAGLHRRIEEAKAGLVPPGKLAGIGIGAPNANFNRGTIEKPVNLNWGDTVNFVELMERYYGIPIAMTNDAKAAAIGEMLFGNARGMKNFMVITLGTGLGSGIVTDGHVVYGNSGFAGELGHTIVDPNGRECKCGKSGCLETYVSATGLVRTVLELMAERCEPNPLREMNFSEITSKRIYELAIGGNKIALEAFDRTARILGMKLADAVAHTSPEAIFLSGGLSLAGDILLKPAQHYLEIFLFRPFKGTVKLMLSGLEPGKNAVLGAAALIWRELE
jgi:glucokinase